MKHTDGGMPAFPVSEDRGATWNGITKRDYFAAAALSTMREDLFAADEDCGNLAIQAYKIADAMLKEREKL